MDIRRTAVPEQSIETYRLRLKEEFGALIDRCQAGDVLRLADFITAQRRLFLTGMGRSGLVARSFAMRLAQMGRQVHMVGETTAPALAAGDGLLAISGSGATATTRARLERVREIGGGTALVTCLGHSQAAEVVIKLPLAVRNVQPVEYESVLLLGGAFELAAELFSEFVVLELVRRSGMSPAELLRRHANLE